MLPEKRKRESMDSAIADMSGDDSFTTQSTSSADDCDTQPTEQEDVDGQNQAKRRRSSCTPASVNSTSRDYGTAASQRPRRAAASQTQSTTVAPQTPQRKAKRVKTSTPDQPEGTPSLETSQLTVGETDTHLHEVKGSHVDREQTPSGDQAPADLPTPPQTVEKTSTQTSLRRSTRERRPTQRSQRLLIEETTPCKKKIGVKRGLKNQSKEETAAESTKSCIVRLRVPSISQPMSFTGSFSHRQRSNENDESQASQNQDQNQDQSFVDNGSFQQHEPEMFAQPQPEPILASSQDVDSSPILPEENGLVQSSLFANLDGTTTTAGFDFATRERFSTSHWISRQDAQTSFAASTPETSPQRQPLPQSPPPAAHDGAAVDNNSWQTQPTLPWCPPWNAPPSADALQSARTEDVSFHASQATTIDEESLHLPRFDPDQPLSKEELHDIAARLYAHRRTTPNPEPVGQPPVWADGRQELCETLHYFRSYQSGSHSTGGFAKGFMFDKVAHPRDYIDSNVVISRAGGGLAKDKDSGEMKASRDQSEDNTSQGLRNCISHYNPVVIITGIDNPHIPSQPPHQYCVLDYFKPTHIWVEKSGKSKILRYRFEKLNAGKESWWRAKSIEDPVELGSLPPPISKSCGTCARESLQIYLNGWMCLQPTCGSFWLIFPSGPDSPRGSEPYEPDEKSLIYDPRFLKSYTPWPNDHHDYPLTSNDAVLSDHAVPGEDTSLAFTRGVVCPQCGRCNSRISWRGWECSNETCTWTRYPPHTLIPALTLRDPLWPLTTSYTASRDTHSPSVTVSVSFAHNYRINRYTIPGIDGFVAHMVANKTVVSEPGGPDDMFEELQQTDIGLRRRWLDNSQVKGGMYTSSFLVNYGMPYKFIAATASRPFSAAARPITATRSRLNWAAGHLLSHPSPPSSFSSSPSASPPTSHPQPPNPFNEVLALSYFEFQKISYHDDGETGLGPTIATLSLGSPATMRIRMKARHYHGVSSAGVYNDCTPIPGCREFEKRGVVCGELEALKSKEKEGGGTGRVYRERLKQIPRELGLKSQGKAKDVLKMEVRHGDVVVMHGRELQRVYEHAVEHVGKLRFALTCRYIDPGSLGGGVEGQEEGEGEAYDGAALGEESSRGRGTEMLDQVGQ